jgi:hypothetical protein
VIDTSYDNYCQLWVQFMTTGCSKLVAKEKAGTHQANRGFRGCHQSCSGDTEVTESGVAYPNCMDKAEAMSALVVGICGAAPLSHLGYFSKDFLDCPLLKETRKDKKRKGKEGKLYEKKVDPSLPGIWGSLQ